MVTTPRVGRAEDTPRELTVERAQGADACPDAPAFEALVRAHLGAGDHEAKLGQLRVRFERSGPGHRALVHVVEGAERVLDDPDPRCNALATGLAIAAAALLDAMSAPQTDPPAGPAEPSAPRAKRPALPRYYLLPAIDPVPPRALPPRPALPISLAMGARMSSGVLRASSTALDVLVDAYLRDVTFGAGLQWAPDDRLVHPGHVVRYAYVLGTARACLRWPWEEEFGTNLCATIHAGERTANQDPAGESTSGLWVAPGAELDVSRRVVGPAGLYAAIASTVPVVASPIDLDLRLEPTRAPVTVELAVGLRIWFDAFESPRRFGDGDGPAAPPRP
jgi:hypothetical protein